MVRSTALVGVLATLGFAADASTISGTFSGTLSAPSDNTSRAFVHAGSGTQALSWGTPSSNATSVQHGNTSVLSVNGGAFDYTLSAPGEVLLGSIDWINQSNWHAGGIWNSAVSLALSLNTASGQLTYALPLTFSVNNTTDATADTTLNETTGNNPDAISGFRLAEDVLPDPIDLGNGYSLIDLVFRLDVAGTPGTAWNPQTGFLHEGVASGSQYDAQTGLWENREGGVSTLGLYGLFGATPIVPGPQTQAPPAAVPLPAGALLMLSGIAGAALIGRRRKTRS